MKYTIEGFSQIEAIKFKDTIDGKEIKIDVTDLTILRWLVDFYPKMSKMTIEGSEYVWVSYKGILSDMPLLDIKKIALANRLKKMVYFGILDFKLVTNGNTYTYYSFGKNYMKLVNTHVSEITTPYHSNDKPMSVECEPPYHSNDNHNNSSINDSSINQSIKNNASNDAMLCVDYFNKTNGTTNTGAKPVIDGLNHILKDYTVDDVKLVIDYMANSWYSENKQNTLSVLAKHTKFYEKLEKAEQWGKDNKPARIKLRIRYLEHLDRIFCDWWLPDGNWLVMPHTTIEEVESNPDKYEIVLDERIK